MFVNLLPMILGTMLAPVWIIIVLLILRAPNGLIKATAFVTGVTLVRLLQGLIFGRIFRPADFADTGNMPPAMAVLLTILGLLLLISAVKTLMKVDDPDAPPPKWMTMFDSATVLKTLGLGLLFTSIAPKLWVFTLSAIGIIIGANLPPAEELKWFLIYVVCAQSMIILPLLVCAIAPHQSAALLRAVSDWLTQYKKIISLVIYVVFGIFFLQKGLSGLLS